MDILSSLPLLTIGGGLKEEQEMTLEMMPGRVSSGITGGNASQKKDQIF